MAYEKLTPKPIVAIFHLPETFDQFWERSIKGPFEQNYIQNCQTVSDHFLRKVFNIYVQEELTPPSSGHVFDETIL